MSDSREKYDEIKRFGNHNNKESIDVECVNFNTDPKDLVDIKYVTPNHYNNDNGSLYKIAEQRGWDAYQFDAIKRIDRVNKKGQFKEDIEKTIVVLKLMLNNK